MYWPPRVAAREFAQALEWTGNTRSEPRVVTPDAMFHEAKSAPAIHGFGQRSREAPDASPTACRHRARTAGRESDPPRAWTTIDVQAVRNNDAWVDAAFHERMQQIRRPTVAIGLRQAVGIDGREFAG
jgi:hypothetical protein